MNDKRRDHESPALQDTIGWFRISRMLDILRGLYGVMENGLFEFPKTRLTDRRTEQNNISTPHTLYQ